MKPRGVLFIGVLLGLWVWASQAVMAQTSTEEANGSALSCDPAVDYLAQGQSQVEAEDYPAAIESFSCAIAAAPDDYLPVQHRIEAALLAGRYIQALDDHSLLRGRFSPQDPGILGKIVISYLEVIEANPDAIAPYMFRNFINWVSEGKEAAALRDCERIWARDPDNAYAYLFCGTLQLYGGDEVEAQPNLTRAIELDPDNPDVYALIGLTYGEVSQFEQSLEDINRAFEMGLDSPSLYVGRADAYAGLGDPTAAAQDYLRHVEGVMTETLEGDALVPDQPVTVRMTAGRVYRLPLMARAGQILSIRTQAEPEVVDSLLVLLSPDGTPLAGNDDSPSLDAALNRVEVPADGTYTLLVISYNGVGEGEIEVVLEVAD